jgi:hypothetical protein
MSSGGRPQGTDYRAATVQPDGTAVAGAAAGVELVRQRYTSGQQRFPDYASYLRYQRGRVEVQRRATLRALIASPVPPPVTHNYTVVQSKDNTTSDGFTIGNEVTKDMDNEQYTEEINPFDFQSSFFGGMADFIDENIVAGDKDESDRLVASHWKDLGDDVFDNWGYFYLYDPTSGKYYFPLITPQNQDDGIFTTQSISAFSRTFTIRHGWAVQGIFKFVVSVADNLPFRFGAYGNIGSDGNQETQDLSYPISGTNFTYWYRRDSQEGDSEEKLYSYFIPKNVAEKSSQTYDVAYDYDNMSLRSKEVKGGLLVYRTIPNLRQAVSPPGIVR